MSICPHHRVIFFSPFRFFFVVRFLIPPQQTPPGAMAAIPPTHTHTYMCTRARRLPQCLSSRAKWPTELCLHNTNTRTHAHTNTHAHRKPPPFRQCSGQRFRRRFTPTFLLLLFYIYIFLSTPFSLALYTPIVSLRNYCEYTYTHTHIHIYTGLQTVSGFGG